MGGRKYVNKIAAFLACLLLMGGLCPPARAADEDAIRVAFYPLEGFFEYDSTGKEVGYGVALLDKISQYTGLQFTYVPSESWEATKYLLLDGQADLRLPATMPPTPSTTLSYSKNGILDTYDVILTLNTRDDLYYQDLETIRTLNIAVSESFYTVNNVQAYLDSIGVDRAQLIFCEEYSACREKLLSGEADALISNIMDMDNQMKLLARFNNTTNYLTMTLNNPSLKILDDAIDEIRLDEPLFLPTLYAAWFPERTTVPLTLEESDYLASIDRLTFAFDPNEGYLSVCKDGAYYGIYVEMAKLICEKLGVEFQAVSRTDCLAGAEETDVYAGFYYDHNYADAWNFSLSAPVKDLNYYIIQKKTAAFDPKSCRIAAIERFKYTSDYLQKQYGGAEFLYFDTYEDCLNAVESGRADMTVVNNYISEYYLGMHQFSDLSVKLSTDYSHLFCFAAADRNDVLASILTKGISMITEEEMAQAYIRGQEQRPDSDFLMAMFYQKPVQFSLAAAGILALIVIVIMLLVFTRKNKRQNLKLEKALSAKSEFLARMSHDMRTPMNGILGLSYLMEEENSIEEIKKQLPRLRDSGKYLLQLINDVLDVNRMETGKLSLNPKPCDEETLFVSVIDMIQPAIKEKNIEFHFDKINIDWKFMLLDEQRVKQIFINLLSNAVKFTPKGGRIDFIIELVGEEKGVVRDRFIVRDNGVGMKPEFLPHALEPFSQEERTNTDAYAGTGLGLSIVRQLVELMGGTISIQSEVDRGTEITLYLNFPLCEKPKEEAARKLPEDSGSLSGKKILLCEDHRLNAEIAKRLLAKVGCETVVCENGKLGVERFGASAEHYFDAVLMDIRMPVMDGLAAAAAIRALERRDAKTVPIIAMTANAYDEDMRKSKEAGINAHLAKPIEPELLYLTLAEKLGERDAH